MCVCVCVLHWHLFCQLALLQYKCPTFLRIRILTNAGSFLHWESHVLVGLLDASPKLYNSLFIYLVFYFFIF